MKIKRNIRFGLLLLVNQGGYYPELVNGAFS